MTEDQVEGTQARVAARAEIELLRAQNKQQAAELAIVNEVGRALAGQLSFGQIVEKVGEGAVAALGVRGLSISIVDPLTDNLVFYYWIDEGERNRDREGSTLGDPLSVEIVSGNRPVRINSAREAAARGTPFKIGGTESYVGVPIPVGDRAIGVFAIGTHEPHAYTDSEERLLTTLASTMGVALENARLLEETRRLLAEMEQAKQSAEAANEAKSTFVASVSHELRTPLTSVVGFAKLIRRQLDEQILPNVDLAEPKTQRAVDHLRGNVSIIVTEGERLTTLINNVLDLAKIEAGGAQWDMQPISMGQVIDRAVAATMGLFEDRTVQLQREVAEDLPEVVADHDALLQVVINLISNAAKFTEHGAVTCWARLTDGGVHVGVTDTGIGIAPADQALVFEKFTQISDSPSNKPQGTGLGLPICREIVEAHGGRIWVESTPGRGSTFAFVLPVQALTR